MKLLVIEDSDRLRETLAKGFSKLGYSVDSASDGKQAINFVDSYQYDVVILDLMLPLVPGLEVLRHIRQSKHSAAVIILSAKAEVEDKIIGLTKGADDYLAKPFNFDELSARVMALARRQFDNKSSIIDLPHGIQIDQSLKLISINQTAIPFTPTEYGILEYLALNKNRVLTFDQIENSMYSGNVYVSKNTLETHVSGIRKKLKLHDIDELIKTRRGFGYVIECS